MVPRLHYHFLLLTEAASPVRENIVTELNFTSAQVHSTNITVPQPQRLNGTLIAYHPDDTPAQPQSLRLIGILERV